MLNPFTGRRKSDLNRLFEECTLRMGDDRSPKKPDLNRSPDDRSQKKPDLNRSPDDRSPKGPDLNRSPGDQSPKGVGSKGREV